MPRPTILLKRSLIFVHRWLGVALSVIFFLWFVSGIVMMYWSYPAVSAADRLERAPALAASQVRLTPEAAYATLGRDDAPTQVRLTSFDGRPLYRFGVGGGPGGRGGANVAVFADDGTEHLIVDDAMIDRAAAAWAGRPVSEAEKVLVDDVDQWTVGNLRRDLPLYKYSWPDGQQVYVHPDTGEVMQYTTTESRFWAYLGAIPHWLYFTPLRKHQPEWLQFITWSSGIGAAAALLGVVIAVWMLSPGKRYRHAGAPTAIPYKGWKRWHTITGLFFGVLTATWAFSGMLSLGPFDWVAKLTDLTVPSEARSGEKGEAFKGKGKGKGKGGPNIANALRGPGRFDLAAYSAKPPATALAQLPAGFEVKELEFTQVLGQPLYLATDGRGETRIIPLDGEPKTGFDPEEIMLAVRAAAGTQLAELRMMDQYDAYYLDRTRRRPLPVIYARMNDAAGTRYYIDPKTARVAGNYSARNWVSRWLYHGLHSLDFPWLYNYRPLWDIVVITLMLGGTAVCVTSLVLTWRVLQRKIAAALPLFRLPPDEDLARQPWVGS
jgi:hypothetical protein